MFNDFDTQIQCEELYHELTDEELEEINREMVPFPGVPSDEDMDAMADWFKDNYDDWLLEQEVFEVAYFPKKVLDE